MFLLAQGSSEAADTCAGGARRASATAIANTKTQVWEELREVLSKNFRLALN